MSFLSPSSRTFSCGAHTLMALCCFICKPQEPRCAEVIGMLWLNLHGNVFNPAVINFDIKRLKNNLPHFPLSKPGAFGTKCVLLSFIHQPLKLVCVWLTWKRKGGGSCFIQYKSPFCTNQGRKPPWLAVWLSVVRLETIVYTLEEAKNIPNILHN